MCGRPWRTCVPPPPRRCRGTAGSRGPTSSDGPTRSPPRYLEWGLDRQATFAQYLHSCPEYLEAVFAAFKLGVPPVNTNYRYGADELVYLWDNADAGVVVFHGAFSNQIEQLHATHPTRAALAVGGSRQWRVTPVGRAVRGRRVEARVGPYRPTVGPFAGRPLHQLHGRHDRAAERRDVASGRPVRGAQPHGGRSVPRGRRGFQRAQRS